MTESKYTPVICIGLGVTGICLGVQLKCMYGLDFADVHFYDRNEGCAGTWWSNRYPGAACDIPAILYSFSFAPNPTWTKVLPTHSEIRCYVDGVVNNYQLAPHMTFRTECESASWDSERHRWIVMLRNLVTGTTCVRECTLLLSAVGQLVDPKVPKIQGMDTFEGPVFHTARWRHDVVLEGKDTIVIGNGCSGSQVVPRIVSQTKTLTQFIRTPHWLVSLPNPTIGSKAHWVLGHIPFIGLLLRFTVFLFMESHWRLFVMDRFGEWFRRMTEKQSKEYVMRVAPKKFHDILIPDWEIACKRRVFDANDLYLNALHAPNLDLVKDDIVEVLPRAVRTASKTYPADVIVLATGFETQKLLGELRIQGRDGEWLHDHWREIGGPSGYNGTAMHGFPNFFMLYGPNGSTGHNSVIMTSENMVNYTLKIIEPILKGGASEVEVKASAEREYVTQVQAVSKTRVISRCNNWYVSKDGWNSTVYPWSQIHFWWRSTFPIWRDWEYKYTSRHVHSKRARFRWTVLVLCMLSLVGAAAMGTRNRTHLLRLALW